MFIPWDMDLSFAGFPFAGGPDQQLDLSVTHPYAGQNKLLDRLFAIKPVSEQYQKILKELTATCFSKETLLKDVDAIEKATKEIIAKEKKATEARKEGGGFGFGPPGGPGMPGGNFGPGNMIAGAIRRRADAAEDGKITLDKLLAAAEALFKEADKDKKGKLDEAAVAAGINLLFPAMGGRQGFGGPGGPGGGPGPGPGGPGGPPGGMRMGGFGMGNGWAKPLIDALDADKDGKLSKDELVAGVKKFFKTCDKDKKGTIDEPALAAGLNGILPAPQMFGPPGGGMFGRSVDMRTFVEKRTASVAAQLAGKSKGYVPTMGFGPGGPGGRPGGPGGPGGFGPGMFFARPLLEALDTDKNGKISKEELVAGAKKLFADSDKDKKGKIDEKALAEGLSRVFPAPPGFGPPGGPGGPPPGGPMPPGPGGPMMFGPVPVLATAIMKRANADKDGTITLAKLVAAAEAMFKECDKDKNGSLDEGEITAGINMLFPPPQFGPPGGPMGPQPPAPPRKEDRP